MANEASPIALSEALHPVRRTVPDAQAIEKYAILELYDNNLVIPCSGAAGTNFGGIAAAEKVANDGSTTISAYMDGVFDLYAVGLPIAAGDAVCISGANTVTGAHLAGGISGGALLGWAEETATTAAETIRVRLRGGGL